MVTGSPDCQRRLAPRLGLFGHATPIRVAVHRGRRRPGRVLASAPAARRRCRSRSGSARPRAPAAAMPRSKTSPTPRLIPPSLGLRRYWTVRQRVFGFLSYANAISSGFSDLSSPSGSNSRAPVIAIGCPGVTDGGTEDSGRSGRRLPAGAPASRWSSTRADTIAAGDQQQGEQDQRPDPAARRRGGRSGHWNRPAGGSARPGDRPRVSEVVTTVGRSAGRRGGGTLRVRRARASCPAAPRPAAHR